MTTGIGENTQEKSGPFGGSAFGIEHEYSVALATTAPANNAICTERFICGGPGQPGERHTQCVRSPGPVPSRCGGATAKQVCGSKRVGGVDVSCVLCTRGISLRRGKPSAGYGRALSKSAVLLNSALFARCCGPSRRPLTSQRLREPMSAQRGAGCQASMSRRYRLPLRSLRKSSSAPTSEVTQNALRGSK
jgi:hypothetical protein